MIVSVTGEIDAMVILRSVCDEVHPLFSRGSSEH